MLSEKDIKDWEIMVDRNLNSCDAYIAVLLAKGVQMVIDFSEQHPDVCASEIKDHAESVIKKHLDG